MCWPFQPQTTQNFAHFMRMSIILHKASLKTSLVTSNYCTIVTSSHYSNLINPNQHYTHHSLHCPSMFIPQDALFPWLKSAALITERGREFDVVKQSGRESKENAALACLNPIYIEFYVNVSVFCLRLENCTPVQSPCFFFRLCLEKFSFFLLERFVVAFFRTWTQISSICLHINNISLDVDGKAGGRESVGEGKKLLLYLI